jgi:hypothetical protein
MDSQNRPQRQAIARLSLVCLAALGCGLAHGQANPFYVGASQSLTHESNLFRGAGGVSESDTLSVTSLLLGLDQPIGRQRLFADAVLRAGRYSDHSQLNYTGAGLLAGVDWEAAESLSGRLSYRNDRTLAPTGLDLGIGDPGRRNMQTVQEFALRGLSSKSAPYAVEVGYLHRSLDYSLAEANTLEFEQDTASVGLLYRPTAALTLGLSLRRTDGSYPYAVPTDLPDDFKRNDVDLSVVWVASGASTVTARLSRTREDHSALPARDVAGNTGALSWNYKPTGKLNLTADYIRDTGAESTFAGGGAGAGTATPVVNSAPRATTLQLRGDYEITAKVQALAFVRRLKRDLVNNAAVPGRGEDTLQEARLGLNWSPLRSVLVGCSVGREERKASDSAVTNVLSTPYNANSVSCMAQFRTQ